MGFFFGGGGTGMTTCLNWWADKTQYSLTDKISISGGTVVPLAVSSLNVRVIKIVFRIQHCSKD